MTSVLPTYQCPPNTPYTPVSDDGCFYNTQSSLTPIGYKSVHSHDKRTYSPLYNGSPFSLLPASSPPPSYSAVNDVPHSPHKQVHDTAEDVSPSILPLDTLAIDKDIDDSVFHTLQHPDMPMSTYSRTQGSYTVQYKISKGQPPKKYLSIMTKEKYLEWEAKTFRRIVTHILRDVVGDDDMQPISEDVLRHYSLEEYERQKEILAKTGKRPNLMYIDFLHKFKSTLSNPCYH